MCGSQRCDAFFLLVCLHVCSCRIVSFAVGCLWPLVQLEMALGGFHLRLHLWSMCCWGSFVCWCHLVKLTPISPPEAVVWNHLACCLECGFCDCLCCGIVSLLCLALVLIYELWRGHWSVLVLQKPKAFLLSKGSPMKLPVVLSEACIFQPVV